MKHTEGPWSLIGKKRRPKEHEHGMNATIMARGHRIGLVDGPSNVEERDTWEANARLILAAPDLLEALELAQATIERLNRHNSADGTLYVVKAAIAKAARHD